MRKVNFKTLLTAALIMASTAGAGLASELGKRGEDIRGVGKIYNRMIIRGRTGGRGNRSSKPITVPC